MKKPKKGVILRTTDKKTETDEVKSMTQEKASKSSQNDQHNIEPLIRILFQGSCPKLSAKGVGDLKYEIGIMESTDESCMRIAGNESSGAFSSKWVMVNDIQSILGKIKEQSFRASVLRGLYIKTSSNNAGFMASILREEGIVISIPQKPTSMQIGDWKPFLEKVDSLGKEGISLTGHIAIAAKERAAKKKANAKKKSDA